MDTRESLNVPAKRDRLSNLRKILAEEKETPRTSPEYTNNHIHTAYSFSPYSPTAAVWFARAAGLSTAGIMDHDSVGGASEFREAAKMAGIGATCGFEARVSLTGTAFSGARLNNPDQRGVAYMAFHSVREQNFNCVQEFFAPLREKRNARNRVMTENLARLMGIELDFDRDVLPLSLHNDGGTVTERHILCALINKLRPGDGEGERYAMLGKMKREIMPKVFVSASDELISLDEAVDFAGKIGAVLCYAYLGDVTISVTGDKSAGEYEDGFLPELLSFMKGRGVEGVTFMPSRNSAGQLARVMGLCGEYGLMQISGEDINSPGQSFICGSLTAPEFRHLSDAARALVQRERDG